MISGLKFFFSIFYIVPSYFIQYLHSTAVLYKRSLHFIYVLCNFHIVVEVTQVENDGIRYQWNCEHLTY